MSQRYCVTKQVESSSNQTWYLAFDQRTGKSADNYQYPLQRAAKALVQELNRLHQQKLNRLARLQRLRLVGAPRWIVKCEQVYLIAIRSRRERYDLIGKYVTPILGQGSITVPAEPEIVS